MIVTSHKLWVEIRFRPVRNRSPPEEKCISVSPFSCSHSPVKPHRFGLLCVRHDCQASYAIQTQKTRKDTVNGKLEWKTRKKSAGRNLRTSFLPCSYYVYTQWNSFLAHITSDRQNADISDKLV